MQTINVELDGEKPFSELLQNKLQIKSKMAVFYARSEEYQVIDKLELAGFRCIQICVSDFTRLAVLISDEKEQNLFKLIVNNLVEYVIA